MQTKRYKITVHQRIIQMTNYNSAVIKPPDNIYNESLPVHNMKPDLKEKLTHFIK